MSNQGDRNVLSDLLDGLSAGEIEVVDLTHTLSDATPVLKLPPGFNQIPRFRLRELGRYDERAPLSYSNAYETGEHVGTHFDAPIHWFTGRDGEDVGSIPASRLIGPAVVIDKTQAAEREPGYQLTVEDIHEFEREHGELPEGGWLLIRTGWQSRWDDEDRFLNDSTWPGPDVECAQYLSSSKIAGFGTESVGIDNGEAHAFEPRFPMHHHLLAAGKYGLTSLANLDRLPPTGAVLIAGPLRIEGGSGSQMRTLALVAR